MTAPVITVLVAMVLDQISAIVLQISASVQWFYLAVGIVLVVAGVGDLLWTTLWTDGGAGPLTSSLMATAWRGLRAFGERRSRVLSLSGPLVLALTLALWILLLWAGWTLIFTSGGNALAYTRGPEPVGWIGRIYFVAYTMFTMGNGDFSPTSGTWRLVTALTNGSGMILLTLSVTYVINVLQAVVKSRSFASSIQGIAKHPEAFVTTGWDGENLDEHDLPLNTFASQLSTIASQHNAYPILHYYRSAEKQHSTPVAVALFDDALSLLQFGVSRDTRLNEPLLQTARSSVQDYLQSVYSLPVQAATQPPPPPDLAPLRDADIPTVSDGEFDDAVEDIGDRRRRLLGIVESQAWQWPSSNSRSFDTSSRE